ncbi:dTDP-L-rhamnose 4-epimerase [Rhodoblastus acidophilus]|uniref:dTDP-L-rhamnose 4-epimerase n=1 Tax=Rhodoblastus acidophilus TaxID=1074 RepID=A0A212RQM7_RHOAC|nr:NAD-dependent epimerase/dehydratase family protein [Rhodoblastus acidophilus]PPQ38535.1 nucleoside-diphosphate-sugar epimerase [Rhodoblastus acidophilus]RAI21848.1 nucleoside-diphosphate-sugar epimerase [Rhodoblastus acidophilus]SNB74758.1 dTDP-L-rhamnose 4-epimerase [Rhodoblastus acidophilus]
MANILITGGAGFIGRHVARALVARGDSVRLFDALIAQVHGARANSIPAGAELVVGDMRDPARVAAALDGVDQVVHLAAEVGVGQSMYEIERYVAANDLGTAVLMQALIARPVRRVVVASSMSIYGEGLYRDADGRIVEATRPGRWDPLDESGRPLAPVPTPEDKRPSLASVYALTKYAQERLTLNVCGAYGMEGVALRLFNVYGPGQALSNPYTGVLAIFAARLLNGRAPLVFEDGRQRRDFIHVSDVAAAFLAALDAPGAAGQVYNIGSGESRDILDVAGALAQAVDRLDIAPELTGQRRAGDIRHCFADISKARAELGFAPKTAFAAGVAELAAWLREQSAEDGAEQARRELQARGLVA